ncbi:unnamed protein product, partial [marine sediment metagenome]
PGSFPHYVSEFVMIQNWKAAFVTAAGVLALAAVVIIAMFKGVDGALYFWVVAGMVWIVRGSLPEIWGRKNVDTIKEVVKNIIRELKNDAE